MKNLNISGDTPEKEFYPKVRFWLPQAAVVEADLREEIRGLSARGFSGVEVVAMVTNLTPGILQGEQSWGTDRWNAVLEIISDETSKLGMTMDIANGPQWPIAMPTVSSADDPAALYELTFGVMDIPNDYNGPLPERRAKHSEGTPELICVSAYIETEPGTLVKDSYVDLTGNIIGFGDGCRVSTALPPAKIGSWKLFAFWGQPSAHKIVDKYYVIDHLSAAGARACEAYWDALLEKHSLPNLESLFCDSLEYEVKMDWTRGLEREFERHFGYCLLPYLPVIGYADTFPASDIPGFRFDEQWVGEAVNNDYTELITSLFTENHLTLLKKIANKHGVGLRYQVAYNKPIEIERCGLFADVPENEALGRATLDAQRTMAAAAHLGRKKRYSFECAAEFFNGYAQTFDDICWWMKRSFMSGMNIQVFHGASYSGGGVEDIGWPGYEAFGKLVSQYWNRTLSIKHMRGCLDAFARMNRVFRNRALVDVAVFRQAYINNGYGSDGDHHYKDGSALVKYGYTYEFLSTYLMNHPNASVNGGVLDAEGAAYKALVIPPMKRIPIGALKRATAFAEAGLPVIWTGSDYEGGFYFSEMNSNQKRSEWQAAFDQFKDIENVHHAKSLDEIPMLLRELGIEPNTAYTDVTDMVTACRDAGVDQYHGLYYTNRVWFDYPPADPIGFTSWHGLKPSYERRGSESVKTFTVSLRGEGVVYRYDPWTGTEQKLAFKNLDGRMCGSVSMEEDELLILRISAVEPVDSGVCCDAEAVIEETVKFDTLRLRAFGPDTPGEKSLLRSGFGEPFEIKLEKLLPWNELSSELEHFAGEGVYIGSFSIPAGQHKAVLSFPNVSDTFTVRINGEECSFPDQVLKRVDVTPQIKAGFNSIEVTVYSTLYNKVVLDENKATALDEFMKSSFFESKPKNYGIWKKGNIDAVNVLITTKCQKG